MNWIEDVYHRGIDTGCGGGNYCPTSPVSRALMAQMVARTWGYQMPFVTPNPGNDSYATTFNAANQLATVQTPSQTVSFTYDGDGMRFSKTSASGTTYYVRDPQGQVIAEYSGTAALLAEYVDLNGQRLCTITHDANNVEHRVYYHADVLGTPVAETNEAGQLVVRAEYDPFGEEVRPGAAADPHKFTGKELDSEIGLYYFGARYYDAHLGRFISVDPVAGSNSDPQSWNRYAYGRNNPMKFVDPTGRVVVLSNGTNERKAQLDLIKSSLFNDKAAGYVSAIQEKSGRWVVGIRGVSKATFNNLGTSAHGLNHLVASPNSYGLQLGASTEAAQGMGGLTKNNVIYLNPGAFPQEIGGVQETAATTLAHEMGHLLESEFGAGVIEGVKSAAGRSPLVALREGFAMAYENAVRREGGLDARGFYASPGDYIDPGISPLFP